MELDLREIENERASWSMETFTENPDNSYSHI